MSDTDDIEENLRTLLEDTEDVNEIIETNVNTRWNRAQTKLLVSERLLMNHYFLNNKKKKEVLWNDILKQIKNIDRVFPFNRDDIMRKFNNMFTAYKRIKSRSKKTGTGGIKWEFFDSFDEVFGLKHSVDPPADILTASLESDNSKDEDDLSEELEIYNSVRKKRTQKSDEILHFFKEWRDEEKKETAAEEIREKEKFHKILEMEERKTQALINLTETLQKFI